MMRTVIREKIVPPISSLRLRLESLGLRDVDELQQLDADPCVREFVDGGRPILWEGHEERALAWFDRLATMRRVLGSGPRGACLPASSSAGFICDLICVSSNGSSWDIG